MSKGGSTYTQVMTKNEQMCGELCGRYKTLDNFRPGHEGSFPSRWYRKDFLEKIASELLLGLVEFWQVEIAKKGVLGIPAQENLKNKAMEMGNVGIFWRWDDGS